MLYSSTINLEKLRKSAKLKKILILLLSFNIFIFSTVCFVSAEGAQLLPDGAQTIFNANNFNYYHYLWRYGTGALNNPTYVTGSGSTVGSYGTTTIGTDTAYLRTSSSALYQIPSIEGTQFYKSIYTISMFIPLYLVDLTGLSGTLVVGAPPTDFRNGVIDSVYGIDGSTVINLDYSVSESTYTGSDNYTYRRINFSTEASTIDYICITIVSSDYYQGGYTSLVDKTSTSSTLTWKFGAISLSSAGAAGDTGTVIIDLLNNLQLSIDTLNEAISEIGENVSVVSSSIGDVNSNLTEIIEQNETVIYGTTEMGLSVSIVNNALSDAEDKLSDATTAMTIDKPNLSNYDYDLSTISNGKVNFDDSSVTDILGSFLGNTTIILMLTLVLTFATVSYILFGKKG